MIRQKRYLLLISSLVTLLPIVVGLILWDRLPETLVNHWGVTGEPDGWSSLPSVVFGTPLTMLAVQWFLVLITSLDSKARERNQKPFGMVLWIIPVMSNLCSYCMYSLALGVEFSMSNLMVAAMAVMFLVIGNYLPKCRQNYTIGIRVPWTFADEETWNVTHRVGGRMWVIGSLVMLLGAVLPAKFGIPLFVIAMLVICIAPIVYSWAFYTRKRRSGAEITTTLKPMKQGSRTFTIVVLVFVAVTLIAIFSLLFVGNIHLEYGDDSFTVVASFYDDLTVSYDSIDSIEYREGNVDGVRTWGYGSFRLLMGYFENEEFGTYTRYTYYNPESCVILSADGKTLVLSGADGPQTKEIYDTLKERTGR